MSYCNGQLPHEHLRPFSLTHVLFDKNDSYGLFMAMTTLIPIGLLCSYASVIITSRSAWVTLAFIGQLGNEVINLALKKYIQHHRPHRCLAGGYGMPSSHSQFIFYFATFTLLCLSKGRPRSVSQFLLAGLLYTVAITVGYSRVHLGYHTVAQVLAGSSLGLIVPVVWYWAIQRVLKPKGILARFFRLPLFSLLHADEFTVTVPARDSHTKKD